MIFRAHLVAALKIQWNGGGNCVSSSLEWALPHHFHSAERPHLHSSSKQLDRYKKNEKTAKETCIIPHRVLRSRANIFIPNERFDMHCILPREKRNIKSYNPQHPHKNSCYSRTNNHKRSKHFSLSTLLWPPGTLTVQVKPNDVLISKALPVQVQSEMINQ